MSSKQWRSQTPNTATYIPVGSITDRARALHLGPKYAWRGRDPRIGNIDTYKCTTKTLADIIRANQIVPHTTVPYRRMDELESFFNPKVVAVAWLRKHTTQELSDAVATLLMMGFEIVVAARSFDDEKADNHAVRTTEDLRAERSMSQRW